MTLIVPFLPDEKPTTIEIDGITYHPPLVDSDGKLHTSAKMIGAGEVKAIRFQSSSDSSVRATILTPTSGKKVRVVSAQVFSTSVSGGRHEIYFGTGGDISIDQTKAIFNHKLDVTNAVNGVVVWPDGGGPVGAVDDVVSFRTHTDLANTGYLVMHYREE